MEVKGIVGPPNYLYKINVARIYGPNNEHDETNSSNEYGLEYLADSLEQKVHIQTIYNLTDNIIPQASEDMHEGTLTINQMSISNIRKILGVTTVLLTSKYYKASSPTMALGNFICLMVLLELLSRGLRGEGQIAITEQRDLIITFDIYNCIRIDKNANISVIDVENKRLQFYTHKLYHNSKDYVKSFLLKYHKAYDLFAAKLSNGPIVHADDESLFHLSLAALVNLLGSVYGGMYFASDEDMDYNSHWPNNYFITQYALRQKVLSAYLEHIDFRTNTLDVMNLSIPPGVSNIVARHSRSLIAVQRMINKKFSYDICCNISETILHKHERMHKIRLIGLMYTPAQLQTAINNMKIPSSLRYGVLPDRVNVSIDNIHQLFAVKPMIRSDELCAIGMSDKTAPLQEYGFDWFYPVDKSEYLDLMNLINHYVYVRESIIDSLNFEDLPVLYMQLSLVLNYNAVIAYIVKEHIFIKERSAYVCGLAKADFYNTLALLIVLTASIQYDGKKRLTMHSKKFSTLVQAGKALMDTMNIFK